LRLARCSNIKSPVLAQGTATKSCRLSVEIIDDPAAPSVSRRTSSLLRLLRSVMFGGVNATPAFQSGKCASRTWSGCLHAYDSGTGPSDVNGDSRSIIAADSSHRPVGEPSPSDGGPRIVGLLPMSFGSRSFFPNNRRSVRPAPLTYVSFRHSAGRSAKRSRGQVLSKIWRLRCRPPPSASARALPPVSSARLSSLVAFMLC